jgi:putative ABC transport system substrate-binding protein
MWPLAARAQQSALPVIGVLSGRSLEDSKEFVAAFGQGLNEAGFFEHRNVAIQYRWAENHVERLPSLAAEFVREQVAVIVAVGGVPPTQAAKATTSTIPIVFIVGGDPIKLGLVASLNRPGANVTGVTILSGALTAKRLELLHELRPQASVACLVNPRSPEAEAQLTDIRQAVRTTGKELRLLSVSNDYDLDAAFATLIREQIGGLLLANDAFFVGRREQIVALAARHAIPTMYFLREFATVGGLMSYGSSLSDAYHRIGNSTGRILRGIKPADLPVEQAVKIELVLNLKTAKALGSRSRPRCSPAPTRSSHDQAARVHHADRRRGGGVAARGARAATRDASHRRADEHRSRRSGCAGSCCCFRAGTPIRRTRSVTDPALRCRFAAINS